MTAAVVVCTASRERAGLVRACVESLLAGARPPDEIVVVVDGNASLEAELADALPAAVRVIGTNGGGLSKARNVGIRAAESDVVAFVDDDATVDRRWLAQLLRVLADDDLLGVGGPVLPRWGADRQWLSDELLWVVGCTYRGHREEPGPIRNPIGCNMAFRRRELVSVGGFATGFGKRGNALETCDETELSLRLGRAYGHGRIHYAPAAVVHHFVPPARVSWRLLVRRSLSEGLSKGRLHHLYGPSALGVESTFVRRLLGRALPRLLVAGVVKRDASAIASAAAVVLSLSITAGAFVAGALRVGRVLPITASRPVGHDTAGEWLDA
jgi:glucosyl-dolichyl phosphate glucuronosyltransferase